MKKSKNFDDIYKALQAETAQALPQSLSPAAIVQSLESVQPQPKKHRAARYASIAAAVAVVVIAAAVGLRLSGVPKSDSVISAPRLPQSAQTSAEAEDAYLRTASYAEIENFFLEKQKTYKAKSYADDMFAFNFNATKGAVPETAYGTGAAPNMAEGTANSGSAPSAGDISGEVRAHGETNTQVEGVDEADILKNDGNYLYIVRRAKNAIEIVDIRDPKQMHTAATVSCASESEMRSAEELYVYGNRLVVLYSARPSNGEGAIDMYRACYAYTVENLKTAVEVYDISDRTAPRLCFDYAVDGGQISSRLDGSTLLLTTTYSVPIYKNEDDMKNACVPCTYQAEEKTRFSESDIRIVSDADSTEYLTVSRLDISADTAVPQTKAVLGGGEELYCDGESLLVAQTDFSELQKESETVQNDIARLTELHTRLYAFDLKGGIAYKGSTQIQGRTLNQFSMDSFGDCYRIATTADSGSIVTVLSKDLQIIGELGGIAKGESIYAARFMGDTAYLVTFYQTDPLFVIDLSDPTAPKVTGELKIPGFSNYLHPYSENLLIGVGQDGTAAGANGHLKISLFDVSDKQNPKEISKAVYSGSSVSTSPVQNTHKAFLTVRESGEFAIPVQEISYSTSAFRWYASMLCVQDGKLQITGTYTPKADGTELTRVTYAGETVFTLSENTLTAFDKATGEILSEITYNRDASGNVVIE